MKKNYRTIEENKLRKNVVSYITSTCNGLISKDEAKKIVDSLSFSELLNHKYEIIITSDTKKAANALTLASYTYSHNGADVEGIREEGTVILGESEIDFGCNYTYKSNQHDEEDESLYLPNFDINQRLACVVEKHDWNRWQEFTRFSFDGGDHEYYEKRLLIYLPAKKKQAATA